MVTANEALQELEKWSLAPRQITAYLHITYGTGTKAATACQVTMRNIQFPTVILNSPRAILGGERLSILLRCTATDVCTFFFFDWNIPSLPACIVWLCFSPRDNDEQICTECPPLPQLFVHYSSRTYREGPCVVPCHSYCNNPQLCPTMNRNETIRGSNSGRLWLVKDNAIPSLYSATMTGIRRVAARLSLFIWLLIQNAAGYFVTR